MSVQTLPHPISAVAFHPNQWRCCVPNGLLPPSACHGAGMQPGINGAMLSWQHLTWRQWHRCIRPRGAGLFWEHAPIGHRPPINEASDTARCPAAYLAVDINGNLPALPPNNHGKGWALAIKPHWRRLIGFLRIFCNLTAAGPGTATRTQHSKFHSHQLQGNGVPRPFFYGQSSLGALGRIWAVPHAPNPPLGPRGDLHSRLQGRISYPAWLCRLKNYELPKFCNINDCSHLLIWQPETSRVVLCSVQLLKCGIFGVVGSWESCSLGLAQQWAASCSYHCSGGTYGQCQHWLMHSEAHQE